MVEQYPAADASVAQAARDHGLSDDAVRALWDALVRGGGRMAQFSHPELGGMGQWSRGGMLQIGDMFNHQLKARVATACETLAPAAAEVSDRVVPRDTGPVVFGAGGDWWPGDFGRPAVSGARNGSRYAYFAERRRLAIERGGRVTLYDTGHHRIFGVSQRRSQGSNLAFTGEDGAISIDDMVVVEG